MSFSANLSGHVDQALPDAHRIEQDILNHLEAVVAKFAPFVHNSSFSGAHVGNVPDLKASGAAGGTTVEDVAPPTEPVSTPAPEPKVESTEGETAEAPPPEEVPIDESVPDTPADSTPN